MTDAPRLRVREVRLFERQLPFRMPFKFGASVTRSCPQAIVRVRVELEDGRTAWGAAAQLLGAKWFDKNPALSNERNHEDLRCAVRMAGDAYTGEGTPLTAFGLHAACYEPLRAQGDRAGLEPLVTGFGPALLDMAIVDALAKARGTDGCDALRANLPGIAPALMDPAFAHFDFGAFMSQLVPRASLALRHTVGLTDALTAQDLCPSDRVDDGLPQTLEEVIASHGPVWFKVKLGGDPDVDRARLMRIAQLLDSRCAGYGVTLDANEQFSSASELGGFWRACSREPSLARLLACVAFIEQPLARHVALATDIRSADLSVPVIIDESDDAIDAFPRARARGYRGISSKSCKGIYKSLINRARCELWQTQWRDRCFMSAEDLTTQPGLSLQQDLLLAGLLGVEHVERNGHHYVAGMVAAPHEEQMRAVRAHPDLYTEEGPCVRVRIHEGRIHFASLRGTGFGSSAEPDWQTLPRPECEALP